MSALDSRACDVEPIHIPGTIQPHGVLVALDAKGFEILQVSANTADFFGVPSDTLVGRPIAAVAGSSGDVLLERLRRARSTAGESFEVVLNGCALDARAHCHQEIVILELERHGLAASASDAALRGALARLQTPNTVSELCGIAVDAIRALTGFDRVLLYRFDEEGHGDVLEESVAEGMDSYDGLRFPASDIPRQARVLYLLNWLRLIPDSSYVPIPLVPERRTGAGADLDMSFASLRSVSPVHLEYLRNMGVAASMSVSLVQAETLWGLIVCHHRTPRHVNFAARAACEVIGRVVSLQIAARQEIESREDRDAIRGVEAKLVEVMRDAHTDVATALLHRGDALLQLVGASGAAVGTAAAIRTVGVTPAPAQIAALVGWLKHLGSSSVFQTDHLSQHHAAAAEYSNVASGLLALTLPGTTPSYVLWFRPELIRTVSWAGNPQKTVEQAGDGRLHPRHSFEAWKQVVRARSRPWSPVEVEAVESLRRRAIEEDLGKQIARAEKAVALRDEMVAVLSHDLRGPLQVVEMAVSILEARVDGDPRATETVHLVRRASARMGRLVHDLLDLAKIEAGRFEITKTPCAASAIVSDAFAILTPIADAKGVRLSWTGDGDAWVAVDAERILQVISNLVGNAIKFTPTGGTVTLEVARADDFVRFCVRDTGPGIPETELAHIFDRYWQARRVRSAGSGLGLYIAKGIVEAHGGRIWADSQLGKGAAFTFSLPPPSPHGRGVG